MQKLKLQLAENLEFFLETKNKELIDETFFAYRAYIFSLKKHKLDYNWRLFYSLCKKYEDFKIGV